MDSLRKLVEDKMKKGVHHEDDEQSSKKKTIALGILQHISDMAEGAMGDDMKNHLDSSNSDHTDPKSGMAKGADRAEDMVAERGEPLHTNHFDDNDKESDHGDEEGLEEESPEHEATESQDEEEAEDKHMHGKKMSRY